MRPQDKCYLRHHGAFLLLAALLAGPQAAEAREVLLTADTRDVSLGQYVEYFEDMQGDLTLDQAIASREWKSAEPDGLRFSPGTSPLWFRFSLVNRGSEDQWVLQRV